MQTRSKMILSGFGGAAVAIIAVAAFIGIQSLRPKLHEQPTVETSNSTVLIQVGPAKSINSGQQNQVYATVQQLVQSHSAPSFDASGFVQYVYNSAGIHLPRTIAEQSQVGTRINSPSQLERGDLVFFNMDNTNTVSFDGIYLGGGQFAAVTTHGLMVIKLSDPFWSGKFQFGQRVLNG